MLLNWLVPQSGGLPFKLWLFHKMIFFQTSSLPRRMLKKFWFTEFRQADPVLFFLTFQVLKYFQTSTINPWRLWNSSFIHRPNLLPLEGEIWCNNSLLVLAVFIVEHWLWIEDKRLIGIFDTDPDWYKIELIVLRCYPGIFGFQGLIEQDIHYEGISAGIKISMIIFRTQHLEIFFWQKTEWIVESEVWVIRQEMLPVCQVLELLELLG